jgi:membrane protein YqaA with SNARE-associated domain
VSWLALFVYSGLAATLLPGGSEILLVTMLIEQPEHAFWLWLIATLGNTLGACITYIMGALLALRLKSKPSQASLEPPTTALQNIKHRLQNQFTLSAVRLKQLNDYGAWLLLLSWVPFIGDGFCLAAGYLGWPKRLSLSLVAIGKAARYGVLWLWLA